MLNNVREPLIPWTIFTRRFEEILKLRRFHVYSPASSLSCEDFVQFFALGQGPAGQYPHVGPTVVQSLGDDRVDSSERMRRDGGAKVSSALEPFQS